MTFLKRLLGRGRPRSPQFTVSFTPGDIVDVLDADGTEVGRVALDDDVHDPGWEVWLPNSDKDTMDADSVHRTREEALGTLLCVLEACWRDDNE